MNDQTITDIFNNSNKIIHLCTKRRIKNIKKLLKDNDLRLFQRYGFGEKHDTITDFNIHVTVDGFMKIYPIKTIDFGLFKYTYHKDESYIWISGGTYPSYFMHVRDENDNCVRIHKLPKEIITKLELLSKKLWAVRNFLDMEIKEEEKIKYENVKRIVNSTFC